jgi:hypothetical protein
MVITYDRMGLNLRRSGRFISFLDMRVEIVYIQNFRKYLVECSNLKQPEQKWVLMVLCRQ